jgi:hypothetical protein
LAFVAATSSVSVFAAVTAEEAAKLKTTLTPLGAERAANNDGSIPHGKVPIRRNAGIANGKHPDLFPSEKADCPDYGKEYVSICREIVRRDNGSAEEISVFPC